MLYSNTNLIGFDMRAKQCKQYTQPRSIGDWTRSIGRRFLKKWKCFQNRQSFFYSLG